MGKLRTQFTDSAAAHAPGLAQWIGRKIRNHDPLEKQDKGRGVAKRGVASFSHVGKAREEGKAYCGLVKATPNVLHHGLADGRVFEITVREIDPEVAADTELLAVGT